MNAIVFLLGILVSSEAAVTWKDCVPPTTAHPYVTFTSLSVSPSPVIIPGNITIGAQGTVYHHFGNDVKMVVHMDKLLLGQWTKVPCSQNVGSCNYDNPCEFLAAFKTSGTCPPQLTQHGLPCTCPFNPSSIDLPPSVFEVQQISAAWQWLATGRFRVQAEMIHNHVIVGCFHVEMDIRRHGGGGLFTMLSKVSVLLAVWSVVRTCDDVNTVACGQLDRVMNVCTDPCFSNLCPRYCGKCPVKCYQCVSGNQADCAKIVECPNMEYACIHERFLTSNFTVGHKSGCVHQQACSMLYGTACHSAGECRDHRGFCCKSDLCNNDATSRRTGRRGYIETDGNDQRRAANRNDTVCHDIDKSSCEILNNSKTNACSLSCFKQACPRTCGVCVECSSCHRVNRPEDCNMTTVCDPDEKCYKLKTRSTNGTYAYNLGCLHQKGCNTLQESAPHALGRSDSIDITIEGHCCSGNLCNQVKPVQQFIPSGCLAIGKKRRDAVLSRKGRSFTWRDCVPSTTAHPYVTFTSMSLSPSPVLVPGNVTVGIQATVHHHFGSDVNIRVHIDKLILGQWTIFPCTHNFGSCNFDNPCELFSAFEVSGNCPVQLAAHGIPCTCPFNPTTIDLPPSVFVVPNFDAGWIPIYPGRFRVRVEMIHGHAIVGCFEIELDTKCHSYLHGFLFA